MLADPRRAEFVGHPIEQGDVREVRRTLAADQGVPAYVVFHDATSVRHAEKAAAAGLSADQVIGWLAEMTSAVKDHLHSRHVPATSILVSTGFCEFDSIRDYHDRLGRFDFFDCHAYNRQDVTDTSGSLPAYGSLRIDKPCLVGECGLGGQLQRLWRPRLETLGFSLERLFAEQRDCILPGM